MARRRRRTPHRELQEDNLMARAPFPPLPHPNEDRDHLAARQSKQNFTAEAKRIRENFKASERYKAQQIAALYEAHVAEIAKAYDSLTGRRRSRLAYLESLVPVGPGIPERTSPADKAVLMTAFRTALATAKEATSRQERAKLLREAEKFDDDAMRRAVLTYALDNGEIDTVKAWSAEHLDVANHLDEVAKLRALLAGQHFDSLWDAQDFNPLPKPQEAHDWPRMEAAAEAAKRAGRQ
ncbi:hypothetical protein GCM10029992_12260 [Glycomyces albus]